MDPLWRRIPTVGTEMVPGTSVTFIQVIRLAARRYFVNITFPLHRLISYLTGNTLRVHYIYQVRTSQETHYVSLTKTNRLSLFNQIIAVYSGNQKKHKYKHCGQSAEFLYTKEGGIYTNHWTLKCKPNVTVYWVLQVLHNRKIRVRIVINNRVPVLVSLGIS
jgi:hypothetical protein